MNTPKFTGGRHLAAAAMLVAATLCGPAALADDSGFYVGGSVGKAAIDIQDFSSDATAWKAFGGYIIDLPVVDFAVEAGYVDFGSQSDSLLGQDANLDATGIDAFGVAGLDLGIFGAFAKLGVVRWDGKVSSMGLSDSNSGTDPAYGVGVRFTFASLELRGEYERFNIKDTDDVNMVSVGLLWRF
jgi:outer membrane immunogenic protein